MILFMNAMANQKRSNESSLKCQSFVQSMGFLYLFCAFSIIQFNNAVFVQTNRRIHPYTVTSF